MKLRIRLTIDVGKPPAANATDPDTEPQIGTHHDTGWTDVRLGFTTPAMSELEDEG